MIAGLPQYRDSALALLDSLDFPKTATALEVGPGDGGFLPELARRLVQRGGRPVGVMNNGLGGNRILHDLRGDSGLRRFDRDVLSQPGVTHVIVMLGTNDLRNRWAKPEEEVTGEQMIAGLQQMTVRAHSARIKIIGATLNKQGLLKFEATKVGRETALAQIVRLVEEAQKSQSRAQTLAQRAAFYLTIIALTAGVLTLIGWLIFTSSLANPARGRESIATVRKDDSVYLVRIYEA